MREIKFKARDKTLNKWLNPDEVRFSISGKLEVRTTGSLIDFVRLIELVEYTGLKDNTKWGQLTPREQKDWLDSGKSKAEWNGKEIYEGDIIRHTKYSVHNYEVTWNNKAGGLFLGEMNLTEKCEPYCEVIGNIYENPELLGGK